jgi:hypothetical protein
MDIRRNPKDEPEVQLIYDDQLVGYLISQAYCEPEQLQLLPSERLRGVVCARWAREAA